MKRREFLSVVIGFVASVLLNGCGGFSNKEILQGQAKVSVDGLTRNVQIKPSQTVLDAIRAAFFYQKNADETNINGIVGNWKYDVNGVEPLDYAGNHIAQDGDYIVLSLI